MLSPGREAPGAGSEAGVAQLVELQPSKLDVAGSSPVARSITERRGGSEPQEDAQEPIWLDVKTNETPT